MNATKSGIPWRALALLPLAVIVPPAVRAHCDTLDGPVVKAAQRALAEGQVNLVLIWVQPGDEIEIKQAFGQTLKVRTLSPEARELADRYFFETLVRIHRAGEGAPYTGLKPAGQDFGPAIAAGDRALETGRVEPVVKQLAGEMEETLRRRFGEVTAAKKFAPNDVPAGRAFVRAYVEYIHFVEGVHQAARSAAHGHFPEATAAAHPGHEHAAAR